MLVPSDINLIRSGTDIAGLDAKITIATYGLMAQVCAGGCYGCYDAAQRKQFPLPLHQRPTAHIPSSLSPPPAGRHTAQPALQGSVLAQNFKCVIVDESHYLKNPKAKRTKVGPSSISWHEALA